MFVSRYTEPEFLPWDGRRVPLTFIGGYLGAGKTTAINELLTVADRPIAVIVNDVGAINLDAKLIRRRSGDVIELTDGCICCSSIDGMGAALDSIRARAVPPDHVVVELSGVADPLRMLPWGQSAGFMLDGIVVVVAADQWLDDNLPALIRHHLRAHVAAADLLVLTKTDLLDADDADRVRKELSTTASGVPLFESSRGQLLPGALGRFLALGGRRDTASGTAAPSLFDAHRTWTIPFPGAQTADDLASWVTQTVSTAPGVVVRAKGVAETPDGLVLVQVVGRRIEVSRLPPPELQDPTDLVVVELIES
jgi:G3E family GTPase